MCILWKGGLGCVRVGGMSGMTEWERKHKRAYVLNVRRFMLSDTRQWLPVGRDTRGPDSNSKGSNSWTILKCVEGALCDACTQPLGVLKASLESVSLEGRLVQIYPCLRFLCLRKRVMESSKTKIVIAGHSFVRRMENFVIERDDGPSAAIVIV